MNLARSERSTAYCRLGVLLHGLMLVTSCTMVRALADTQTTIATDRPAVTESSVVVPEGGFQIENGFLATDSDGRYILDFPESDLRYGILANTELRFSLPDDFQTLGGGASGFGDSAIGIKQQLGSLYGIDLSLVGFVTLPSGAQSETAHRYDPGVQLPWSRNLSPDWTLAGQLAFYWPTVNDVRNKTGEATILVDRQLSGPWDAFIEYAGDFPQRGGSSQLLHVGTAYKLSPHQQLDLHAAAGLSAAAPRWFVGIGYSFLFLQR
jgi:hypothetical protein